MAGPATTEEIDQLARALDFIGSQLTPQERDRFALELLDATRHGDEQGLRELLTAWLVSIHVSQHPDFRRQFKEYQNLVQSGELLRGVQAAEQRAAEQG
ncbi:MAG TPA: hypothetical protein VG276_29930 [Actinomycetes bacterium]|jgi:hypothetical protein|nr:hypothetical protein [Actinomycetes bacterium]